MVRSITSTVDGVNGREYCRIYLKRDLVTDSAFPFRPKDEVRAQLVTTSGDKEVLVVLPSTLEVDVEATDLEIRRSTNELQVDLEGRVEADGGES